MVKNSIPPLSHRNTFLVALGGGIRGKQELIFSYVFSYTQMLRCCKQRQKLYQLFICWIVGNKGCLGSNIGFLEYQKTCIRSNFSYFPPDHQKSLMKNGLALLFSQKFFIFLFHWCNVHKVDTRMYIRMTQEWVSSFFWSAQILWVMWPNMSIL